MVTFLDANGLGCRRLRSHWAWAWLVVALFWASQAWAAPSVTASLERETISLGESVTLTLDFQDCTPAQQPNLPNIPGIRANSTGYSTQTVINGNEIAATTSYTYELRPAKEGDYTIPSVQTKLNDGKTAATKPLTLKVVKGTVPQAPDTPEAAFVRIVTPKNEVYVGEALPIEIHCFCQNARDVQLPQLTGTGYTAASVTGPLQPIRRVQISNTIYNEVVFRATVTPLSPGPLVLGPATWSVTLLSGTRDFFGNFSQAQATTLTSDTPSVQVLALPTNNVPPGFSGAIGNFSLVEFEATPTNVTAGDPITIKARIAGTGAFDRIILPQDVPEWGNFKLYPASAKFDSKDPLQLDGSKYFEQVVIPQNTSVKEIPAFKFTFFDPSQKSYRTLSHPAVPLKVLPALAPVQPTIVTAAPQASETPPPAQEIVHIKPSLGTVVSSGKPLITQGGFLALQTVAPLAWIAVLLWRREKDKLAKNPRLLRQREVARIVQEGLKKLPELAHANKTEEFYAAVFHLLQEQLGERLDLPASAITEAVLDELEPGTLDDESIAALRELFQICNLARYAPRQTGQELASLLQKIQSALNSLQRAQPRRRSLKALGCALLFLAATTAHAESPATAFDAANKLYEQRRYSEAAAAYQRIIDAGVSSPALYFNLGNACFRSGQAGQSILAYRKAGLLAPRDPDIRANLQFVRNQVGNQSRPASGLLARWLERLTLNEWTVATACAVALFFGVLMVQQLAPQLSLRATTITLVLVCAGLIVSLSMSWQKHNNQSAVVTVPETVVRLGPFVESQSVYTLKDGTELTILGHKEEWLEVSDPAKHTGWVLQKEVGLIQ